jgi:CheY-like chemotaxis protein
VLISDLAMPEEDGYAFIRELRARGVTADSWPVAAREIRNIRTTRMDAS